MPRRLALLTIPAACLLVTPAKAQSSPAPRQSATTPSSGPAAAIDPMLVGNWELDRVERLGEIEDFGVAVDEMECEFGADGEAHVALEVVQDLDTHERDRAFHFVTTAGRIVADQGPEVAYEVVSENELRLTTADGLVVMLRRSAE